MEGVDSGGGVGVWGVPEIHRPTRGMHSPAYHDSPRYSPIGRFGLVDDVAVHDDYGGWQSRVAVVVLRRRRRRRRRRRDRDGPDRPIEMPPGGQARIVGPESEHLDVANLGGGGGCGRSRRDEGLLVVLLAGGIPPRRGGSSSCRPPPPPDGVYGIAEPRPIRLVRRVVSRVGVDVRARGVGEFPLDEFVERSEYRFEGGVDGDRVSVLGIQPSRKKKKKKKMKKKKRRGGGGGGGEMGKGREGGQVEKTGEASPHDGKQHSRHDAEGARVRER